MKALKLNFKNRWQIAGVVFTVMFIICGFIAINSLRSNNLKMIELRNAVYETDKNDGDIEAALRNLRSYVYSHMNTDLSSGGNSIKPPIQLKYRYERLAAAQKKNYDSVYTAAQAYCESQNEAFSGRTRVPCIESYVTAHGGSQAPVDESLYKFDFVSPRWTADLAGLSLAISLSSLGLAAACWLFSRRAEE